MEEPELVSAAAAAGGGGGGDGLNLGVALSILFRCDNASLRKLCKWCKKACLGKRGEETFFTQQHSKKKLEYHAVASLWKSFQLNDGAIELSLVSILKPLVEEWTSCTDSVRRGLLLLLTCSLHHVHGSNFTSCLAAILAEEGNEMQYACMLLLRNVVKDISNSSDSASVKAQSLDVLSSLLPQLIEISTAEGSAVPTKLTSLASDCILLVIIEMLHLGNVTAQVVGLDDSQYWGGSNRGLDKDLLPSARWLWERLSLLGAFLRLHQRWAKGLSGMGEGVVCNAQVMVQSLQVMEKRVARMLSFAFADNSNDEDGAKLVHAYCWIDWAPLLLFDLKTYCTMEQKHADTNTLKKVTSALKYAAQGEDHNTMLSIKEALFRELVSAGLRLGLGRYQPNAGEKDYYLTNVLDAMADILDSPHYSTSIPLCILASDISTFVVSELNVVDLNGDEEQQQVPEHASESMKRFMLSIFKACQVQGNIDVSKPFLKSLLSVEGCLQLVLKTTIELLETKEDSKKLGIGLAALEGILDELHGRLPSVKSAFDDQFATIIRLVINLDKVEFQEKVQGILGRFPAREILQYLLAKLEEEEQGQGGAKLASMLLLSLLQKISPSECDSVRGNLQAFMQTLVVSDPSKLGHMMKELGGRDEDSDFWNVVLDIILQISAGDPSNQNLIEVLSSLSVQLSSKVGLVSGFVLRSLQEKGRVVTTGTDRDGVESTSIFARLHPFLVLRIVSKASFDKMISQDKMAAKTRVSEDDDPFFVCNINDYCQDSILGFLLRAIQDLSEEMQVRKVCSELCGKMDPKFSFFLLEGLLKSSLSSRSYGISRACMYACCCSFATHKDSESSAMLSIMCNRMSGTLMRLYKQVSFGEGVVTGVKSEEDLKKTQLGCLDCFGTILLYLLEQEDALGHCHGALFSFRDAVSILLSEEGNLRNNKLAFFLLEGAEQAVNTITLETHVFVANTLISICPRLKETSKQDTYASLLISGSLKHMILRTPEAYFSSGSDSDKNKSSKNTKQAFDESLLQVLFISLYHLAGAFVADFAPDLLRMIIIVLSKEGMPTSIQVAASRMAACVLTKDDPLVLSGCKDVLLDLEGAMVRSVTRDTTSVELKQICQAVLVAMSKSE